ncbi:MAG: sigma-70 family RNA polymerase sigma factor [Chloroflexi bacterium]|nr:MAG: sigma-70 family RNA polymerase sigma factor [Chloroflexota bacterium]
METTRAGPAAEDRATDVVARLAVDAVLAGNREAFRTLVEREGPGLVRLCYRVLSDLSEAEDVAQESFVIAFRSLPSWRREGPFGAWLSRIGLRVALRRASQRRQVAWLSSGAVSAQGEGDERLIRSLVAPADSDPASVALAGERSAIVRAAVRGLDEPYRETVLLRFFADLPLTEIAAETGRPLGTVKTHLHRGLTRLRLTLLEDASAP